MIIGFLHNLSNTVVGSNRFRHLLDKNRTILLGVWASGRLCRLIILRLVNRQNITIACNWSFFIKFLYKTHNVNLRAHSPEWFITYGLYQQSVWQRPNRYDQSDTDTWRTNALHTSPMHAYPQSKPNLIYLKDTANFYHVLGITLYPYFWKL